MNKTTLFKIITCLVFFCFGLFIAYNSSKKTKQQEKAYNALNGERTIKEIAKISSYSSTSTLESLLPAWERKGFILSTGHGRSKKYVNIENLEI